MAAQNIYDDPDFLAGYITLQRQVRGLDGAAEWPSLRSLLPDIVNRHVVDLGCGFGWFSRWANEHEAASVLGIDVSTRMLERASSQTTAESVQYRRCDLDELVLEVGSADLVFSSLAMHYVHDLDRLISMAAMSGRCSSRSATPTTSHGSALTRSWGPSSGRTGRTSHQTFFTSRR